MSILTIGQGLKTVLDTIEGLRVFSPDELEDTVNDLPAAIILPGDINYDTTFDADYDYNMRVIVLLARQDAPSAFSKVVQYLEPTGDYSIVAKVKADKTLSSSCDSSKIIRNTGIGQTNWGGVPFLSTEFEIAIWA